MVDWTIVSPAISFLSMVAVCLIGILYRNLIADQREIFKDLKEMRDGVTALQTHAMSIDKDLGLIIPDANRITALEGKLENVTYRLDRHHDDLAVTNARLDFHIRTEHRIEGDAGGA